MCKQDSLLLIRLDLPSVSRVRFLNIDDEELYAFAKLPVKLLKVPSLGTKRRSGVAAENQRDRLLSAKCRQTDAVIAAKL